MNALFISWETRQCFIIKPSKEIAVTDLNSNKQTHILIYNISKIQVDQKNINEISSGRKWLNLDTIGMALTFSRKLTSRLRTRQMMITTIIICRSSFYCTLLKVTSDTILDTYLKFA